MNADKNKRAAMDFYRMAYNGNPRKAVDLYVGDKYIQHNPAVDNGTGPFIDYFEKMARELPGRSIDFVRGIAEDDLVMLHTHQVWPDDEEYITMDIFRFDKRGKIVEHWDAIQHIPDKSANGNTMY